MVGWLKNKPYKKKSSYNFQYTKASGKSICYVNNLAFNFKNPRRALLNFRKRFLEWYGSKNESYESNILSGYIGGKQMRDSFLYLDKYKSKVKSQK